MEDGVATCKTSTPSSSINTLFNVDILWSIFWENTDMLENYPPIPDINGHKQSGNKPLDTLRRASQVCRLWREITLGSSILWGRVIDLNHLQWRHRLYWRKEVMRRAGDAPLHVYGAVKIDLKESQAFLGELLDQHWSSIHTFVVAITGSVKTEQPFNADIWRPLYRPSPILQTFRLFFESQNVSVFGTPDQPLFADTAPSLCSFAFRLMKQPPFSPSADWLQQLRFLELSAQQPCFQADAFMTALSNMPHLESLHIRTSIVEPSVLSNNPSQIVPLKSLRRLAITETFRTSLFLLKRIDPSPICTLKLENYRLRDQNPKLSGAEIEDMGHAISRYTSRYIVEEQEPVRSLALVISPSHFMFTSPQLPHTATTDHRFHIFVQLPQRLPSALISNLFSTLFDPQAFLYANVFQVMSLNLDGLNKDQLDTLGAFLSSLVAVTELKIISNDILGLSRLDQSYPDIFPCLQKISVENTRALSMPAYVTRFLQSRTLGGQRPITFVLPDMPASELNMLLTQLNPENIQGLKVIFRKR